jgi:hypothetical protein
LWEALLRRFALFVVAVLAALGSLTSPVFAAQKVLTNTDLQPIRSVPGPTIAGVPAGGRAWTISNGSKARVDEDGEVRVVLHGLVFADTKTTLPVTQVKASVVCGGAVTGTTDLVSITPDGDAEIRATVSLPADCSDPIVLIRVAGGAWIAATRIP